MKRIEYRRVHEVQIDIQIGRRSFSKLVESAGKVFVFVDSEVRWRHGEYFDRLPHHVVAGGEVEKSVGTAFELYPMVLEVSRNNDGFVVVGGGTVIDVVGYAVKSVAPNRRLIVVPTTLSSMVSGFLNGRFYLNYDWKKNRISIPGSPNLIVVDPTFVETEFGPNRTFGWLMALCNAISYDSSLFDYLNRNLFELDLEDLVWMVSRLRADNAEKGLLALGENLVDLVQEASGLRLAYPIAYAFSAVMELELSFRAGFLSMKDYLKMREILGRFRPERRIAIDFSHIVERIVEGKREVRISVLQGMGHMTTIVLDAKTLRRHMVEALEGGLSLIG